MAGPDSIRLAGEDRVIRPARFPGGTGCKADLRFRSSRLKVEIDRPGAVSHARLKSKKILPRPGGSILVPARLLTEKVDIIIDSRQGSRERTLRASVPGGGNELQMRKSKLQGP